MYVDLLPDSTKVLTHTLHTNQPYARRLQGSCQCGGVQFALDSQTPVPYQLCACSICRKVGGYSGSVNLGGIAESLVVHKGEELIKYVFCPDLYIYSLQGMGCMLTR